MGNPVWQPARFVRARRFVLGALFGAAVLLATPHVAFAQKKWTLGSPAASVRSIQGEPDLVEQLQSLGVRVWHFGTSIVRMSYDDSRVVGWANTGALKVELRAGADTTRERAFGVGSTRDEVVRLEGTPSTLVSRAASEVVMQFGAASVRIGAHDGRVRGWTDPDHTLHTTDAVAPVNPAPRMPAAPASLSATIAFVDDGDDNVLDGEERATITATVRNTGKGTAFALRLAITATPAGAVTVASTTGADSILPGRSATLRAVVVAGAHLRDGDITITASVQEANGFDLDPVQKIVVRGRAVRAPQFAIEGLGVADQSGNGRIEPREIADVTARVINRGAGDARDVRLTIAAGDQTVLTPESLRDVRVGLLRAGESRDVHFSGFTNSRATALAASISVHESRARFDTALVVSLPLDRPLTSIPSLIVRGRDPAPATTPPPLVVDVDTGVPRGAQARNAIAVVLGVERYQHAPAVPFARHDAAVFREYASKLFGVGDDPDRLFYRTDDELTAGEMRKVFGDGGWLARRVSPATDVIVYFAGHGVADLKTHAPYLLPNDADPNYPAQTGYALSELYEKLAALNARTVTVFVDACFSGGTRDGRSLFPGARDVVVSVEHPALRSETMAVFTASAGDQLANVATDRQHGLMTYWLLKGLRGSADADADKYISVAELDQFLRKNVPGDAAKQDREQMPQAVARNKARILVGLR